MSIFSAFKFVKLFKENENSEYERNFQKIQLNICVAFDIVKARNLTKRRGFLWCNSIENKEY